jgi:uncharacterized protein
MTAFVKRHPLLLYFVLACAWFWGFLALDRLAPFHFWAPMVGALAPTVSAVVTTALTMGETHVRELVRRLWKYKVDWLWYVAAFGIPLGEGILAIGIASAFGRFHMSRINLVTLRASLPALWVVFLFAAGEELGWRGYALPRLLSRHGAVVATLILGGLHALWHWPLLVFPHMWLSDIPIVPWTTSVIAEAFVFTWIMRGTKGSVLLAALFHGMSNMAMILYDGIDPRWMPWLRCGVGVVATTVLLLFTAGELRRGNSGRAGSPTS